MYKYFNRKVLQFFSLLTFYLGKVPYINEIKSENAQKVYFLCLEKKENERKKEN